MKKSKKSKTTNARRFSKEELALLHDLKSWVREGDHFAWRIGDRVALLKSRGITVAQQAEFVTESPQRLREMRRTAAAFDPDSRRKDISFCYHGIAARSAGRLGLDPVAVIDELVEAGIQTTRQATKYLAAQIREREALRALFRSQQTTERWPNLWRNCHLADFRDHITQLPAGSAKLIIADPPYGAYGANKNGNPVGQSAAALDCEGMDDQSARALHLDLFRVAAPLMMKGGCLIVCRPGGHADPSWLTDSAEAHGWVCRHAVSWRRGPGKLGSGSSPYTSTTERLLVFARRGDQLINHDGSSPSDILEVPQSRKSLGRSDQHGFEKPVELMELLISKHTYPGETVIEPFGATGPASRAAIRLGRTWMYVEQNEKNYKLGSGLIAAELGLAKKAAG